MSYVTPIMAIATGLLSLMLDPWHEFRKSDYFNSSEHILRSSLLMLFGGTLAFFMVKFPCNFIFSINFSTIQMNTPLCRLSMLLIFSKVSQRANCEHQLVVFSVVHFESLLSEKKLDPIAGINRIYSRVSDKCSNSNNSRGCEGSCYYFGIKDYLTVNIFSWQILEFCLANISSLYSACSTDYETLICFQVAVLYFHDQFTWMKGLGLLTIMAGVSLFNWYK